jgi:hypothetical protein
MQYAVKRKRLKFVELLLLSPKFNINSDYNKNLLIAAYKEGDIELVKLLLTDS